MTTSDLPGLEVYVQDRVATNDVVAVRVEGYLNGETITATGSAKRNPEDSFDLETGYLLAYGRALDSLARRLLRRGNGLVKHRDDLRSLKAAEKGGSKKG